MNATDVKQAFGFKSETMLSKMRKGKSNISQLHIDGLEKYFDIPTEVFNSKLKSEDEIYEFIKTYREDLEHKKSLPIPNASMYDKHSAKIFPKNEKLFRSLQGTWYGYVYPSNPASAEHGIWEVPTSIKEDYSVVDKWGNTGYLKIGKNESIIIKESYEHQDLTIIRFSNRQVPSGYFRFVIVSNQNHTLHEMVNFGFFSRTQLSPEEAKEILGDRESKQLKLNLEFNERLIERTIVPQ